jgi:hypothetical protein
MIEQMHPRRTKKFRVAEIAASPEASINFQDRCDP